MNQADLRRELIRASADVESDADPQGIWTAGVRARRRQQVIVVAGAAVVVAAIAAGGVATRAIDSTVPPEPRPEVSPNPPDELKPVSVPYLTEDHVQPPLVFAHLDSIPWDGAVTVRSWDPVDPVPLADDPVEHASVVVQSDDDEPDAIFVLGDDGRWRLLDLTGIELSDSYEYDFGVANGSLSPDGTHLALGQVDGAVVVDLTTGERTTYDVPGLGPRYFGRYAVWSSDAETLYVGQPARGRGALAGDVSTGQIHRVPFDPMASAELADGHVVESHWSDRTGMEIRVYDAHDDLVFRSRGADDVLDDIRDLVASGDRLAAQRFGSGNWTSADPRGPNAPANGVLVMGSDVRPQTFLPVEGYGPSGNGDVLGWRGDDTVLFQISHDDEPTAVLAWNVDTGGITRIADHTSTGNISVAADYLP